LEPGGRRARQPASSLFALLAALVVVLVACGGQAETTVRPVASPSPTLVTVPASVAATDVPGDVSSSGPNDEGTVFTPPDPVCPGPGVAVEAPRLLATVDAGRLLMTPGSSGVMTCSTTSSSDVVGINPTIPLHLAGATSIRISVPPGWHFLYWEGWDRRPDGGDANVTPGGETPDGPTMIEIPAPRRAGRSMVGISAWVATADGRVVSGIEGAVLVEP
jgi:hypothetical protein